MHSDSNKIIANRICSVGDKNGNEFEWFALISSIEISSRRLILCQGDAGSPLTHQTAAQLAGGEDGSTKLLLLLLQSISAGASAESCERQPSN